MSIVSGLRGPGLSGLSGDIPAAIAAAPASTKRAFVATGRGEVVLPAPTENPAVDGPALTDGLGEAVATGKRAILQPGNYVTAETIELDGVPMIYGPGYNLCKIYSASDGPAMLITPPAESDNVGCHMTGFGLLPTTAGLGTAGLAIVLPEDTFFSNYIIENLQIGDFGGYGLVLDNAVANTDGFFTGIVRKCFVYNGIHGIKVGDSVQFKANTITGAGAFIGMLLTSMAGARQMVIQDNNLTTQGGAIALLDVQEPCIRNNQIEHPSYIGGYLGPYDAHVYLYNCYEPRILENTIAPSTVATQPAYGVLIDGGSGGLVQNNEMSIGSFAHVGTSGSDHAIGRNKYTSPAVLYDTGAGTRGVFKTATLLNDWANHGGYVAAGYIKDLQGRVHLQGVVGGGSTVNAVIFTLPTGFRPPATVWNLVAQGTDTALLEIQAGGDVLLAGTPAAALNVSLCGVSFIAA